MSKQNKKYTMSVAGEYFVAAELNYRGIPASITYGNAKKADIVAFSPERKKCEVIEVKTTEQSKWVVGGKMPIDPDLIWIFVLLSEENSPRYFIMSGADLFSILEPENIAYRKRYFEKHGVEYNKKGVVSLKQKLALPFEDNWELVQANFD
jgi:hypothetical protein